MKVPSIQPFSPHFLAVELTLHHPKPPGLLFVKAFIKYFIQVFLRGISKMFVKALLKAFWKAVCKVEWR
jgi:hypothetical protein